MLREGRRARGYHVLKPCRGSSYAADTALAWGSHGGVANDFRLWPMSVKFSLTYSYALTDLDPRLSLCFSEFNGRLSLPSFPFSRLFLGTFQSPTSIGLGNATCVSACNELVRFGASRNVTADVFEWPFLAGTTFHALYHHDEADHKEDEEELPHPQWGGGTRAWSRMTPGERGCEALRH